LNLCFVSLHAFPVFLPSAPGLFGGTETRAATIARGMQQFTDHKVSFLTRNYTLKQPQRLEDIDFIPWRDFWTGVRAHVVDHVDLRSGRALPKLKKWSPHLLWEIPSLALLYPTRKRQQNPYRPQRVFEDVQADVYLSFSVGMVSAAVVANAKRTGKPCIVFTGSDSDVDFSDQADPHARRVYGESADVCRWVLENADHVVVQNEFQQACFRDQFGRESTLLRNPIDPAFWQQTAASAERPEVPFSDYILWVGRAEAYHKRAPLALEVARKLPDLKFVFVMNPRDPDLERELMANMPRNVHVIPRLPYSQMPGLFRGARVYFNTSAHEGFPNAFLQAAACGVPISSLEIAPEFVHASHAGLCAEGDLDQQAADIRTLFNATDSRMQQTLEYVDTHYSLQAIVKQLDGLLQAKFNA